MLCTVLITKKYVDEDLPRLEWDDTESGILEVYINHTDGEKAIITIDAEFLSTLVEGMDDGDYLAKLLDVEKYV